MNPSLDCIPRPGWRRWSVHLALVLTCFLGCTHFSRTQQADVAVISLPNPIEVPVEDPEFVWNQIVDTVDDYFPIAREERVRLIGNVMTEGRIETQMVPGASILEIFRKDSTPGFERWHSTFQSIRRQGEIRVAPSSGGYAVSVIVRKELEDVDRPEMSLIGSAVQRHDGSLVRPRGDRVGGALSLGWIPIGRDVSLEQKILADLSARLTQVLKPPPIETLPTPPAQ